MFSAKFRKLFVTLGIIATSFAFVGGDCGTEADPPPPVTVAAPTAVDISVDAVAGGGSFAIVSWAHSSDQGKSDFSHYRIVTYQLNDTGKVIATFDEKTNHDKNSTTYTVNSISRSVRYQTYIQAVLNDGTRSDSVATKVYGGVFFNDNQEIDEFLTPSTAQSGYGWDPSTGAGTQYSYTTGNSANIDLHLRDDDGTLHFFSPNTQSPGTKNTLMGLVGTGKDAFNKTELNEPTENNISVAVDNVYLLKTQENNYIKVWVKGIETSAPNLYQTVKFNFKVQPIEGLRIVKR